jgi:prefoldin subunit 5
MVSEEQIKEIRDRVDRQHRELYKAIKILTRDMIDLNYSKEDLEEIRDDIHQRIDRYMNAELDDKELLFPVDKEYTLHHND